MEFEFPKYPFLWDYSDMYNLINYTSKEINLEDLKSNPDNSDEHLIFLADKFAGSKIIEAIQTVNSRDLTKNLNIHTWYLSQLKVFEQTESNIKIITDSRFKYKAHVRCFVYDPMDQIDNTIFEKKKFPNVAIIKKKTSVIPELIPSLYIHTHNIKGIFRFSPSDNNKINLKESVKSGIFYIVLDKLILKLEIQINE
jgi:hypothetical protein